MEANELRVGNWITGCNGRQFQIDAYGILDVFHQQSVRDCLTPIALTPEILEKAGFKNMNFKFIFNDVKIMQNSAGFDFYWIGMFLLTIHNVHQLQNILFALTGQELEIEF